MLKKFRIVVNGEAYEVEIEEVGAEGAQVSAPVVTAPRPAAAPARAGAPKAAAPVKNAPAPVSAGASSITSPMPGTIIDVKVGVGDSVKFGQPVVILEAMKMENEIIATADGTVKEIRVQKGATVSSGDVLVVIG